MKVVSIFSTKSKAQKIIYSPTSYVMLFVLFQLNYIVFKPLIFLKMYVELS